MCYIMTWVLYWDQVTCQICVLSHAASCSFCPPPPLSLFPSPCHIFTHHPPHFSQYGPAQSVGTNPYRTIVIANVMCHVLRERKSREKRRFLFGSCCRKVISVVMYYCFGNIRFLTHKPQLLGGGSDSEAEEKTKRWDGETHPGTLGRFLTVQVLCHLGQKKTSH